MLAIPEAIQTLLTSKMMVGDNRPTATVTIEDAPTGGGPDYNLPTLYRPLRMNGAYSAAQEAFVHPPEATNNWYGGHWSIGMICELPSGKKLVTYNNITTGKSYLAVHDTWDTLLAHNNWSATLEYEFTQSMNDLSNLVPFVSPADGEVYLLEIQPGVYGVTPSIPCVINLYKSGDKGLADNWTFQSQLFTETFADGGFTSTSRMQSSIGIFGDTIIVTFPSVRSAWGGYPWCSWRVLYSLNGGVSWSTSVFYDLTSAANIRYDSVPFQIIKLGNTYYISGNDGLYTGSWGVWSSTDLISWTSWTYGASDMIAAGWSTNFSLQMVLFTDTKYLYVLSANDHGAYRRPLTSTILSREDLINKSKWEDISQDFIYYPDDYFIRPYVSSSEEFYLVLVSHSEAGYNSFAINGYGGLPPQPLRPKSITIDRSKGAASQATVVLDNKLGFYAPDSTGAWNQVIWPNKQIAITLGYGAEQQLVFTGLIDEVYMSSYPAQLTITARDYSKLALDQIAETTIGAETVYSFAYINKTPEYIFADMAVQAGWAAGDIHADVTGITLVEFLTGHESIADCFQRLCEITGWEWFCDEQGDIYFRAATDPAAVSVYSFTEGVDIFSLDYRISDAELYRTIVVWTSDANGATLKASGEWPAADYNNILAKKTLIINAGDLVTDQAGCAAIVAAESAAITPKVREVNFVAVGNPYIQIGDVIQVTETTTTISEYYRVLEISHQMSADGSPVFSTALRCYHFSMPT